MTEQTFWQLIEQSKINQSFSEEGKVQVVLQIIELTELLSEFDKEELIAFELILRTRLKELYTGKIVELFVLTDNEIAKENVQRKPPFVLSDDQFLYFRCWLILQGEAVFEAILKNPEEILHHNVNFTFTWGESLLYATDEAYTINNQNEETSIIRQAAYEREPNLDYDFGGYKMAEKPNYSALENKYPKLIAALS